MTFWMTWVGDLLIFLIFAAVGRASHGLLTEDPVLWGVARAAAPFVLAWWVVAGAFRLYRSDPALPLAQTAWRIGLAWLGAWALGLLLRSLLLGRPAPIAFALITLAGNGILLIAWRLLLQVWIRRQVASGAMR
ncbi:DUF3054 domain-containing protein [Thermoflexus sp.]|uniref:DUF3054 domain-containing protein n=1 Tax=Thermoflexus sp. TaxID=1969742 RepID=UPI0035E45E8F